MKSLFLAIAIIPLTGCAAMVVTNSLERQQDRKFYMEYCDRSDRNNIEREKAGLSPNQVMSYKEWLKETHK